MKKKKKKKEEDEEVYVLSGCDTTQQLSFLNLLSSCVVEIMTKRHAVIMNILKFYVELKRINVLFNLTLKKIHSYLSMVNKVV